MKETRLLKSGKVQQRVIALVASVAVVVGCVIAIVSTYDRLSQTTDESNHIATGVEWLQDGTYLMWTENPPLARVAVALGPYLSGSRLPDVLEPQALRSKESVEADCGISYGLGSYLLYETGDYRQQLAFARVGTLPFFILAAVIFWFWLGRKNGLAGFLSIAAFCTLPAILAHSGLATTDMAFTAMFLVFIWQMVCWLEDSTSTRSIWLGIVLGLAVATKFTALVFIPAASIALVAARIWHDWHSAGPFWKAWRSRMLKAILVIAPIAMLILWGSYRFSVGKISELPQNLCGWVVYGPAASGMHGAFANWIADMPLPAPEFFHGVVALLAHNATGHWAYALGDVSQFGFWYFYPLALLVKTPFPFMIFVGAGLVAAAHRYKERPWWVGGIFGAILLILLALSFSQVNIGLRHALAVYGLAAVGAAAVLAGWIEVLDISKGRIVTLSLVVLLGWQVAEAAWSHPSFLTYFNPIARDDPGAYLVDSDLDWGQGVFDLEAFFSTRDADVLYIAYFGGTRLCEHDLPELRALPIGRPIKGWIAVSEFFYREAASFLMVDPCGPDYRYLDHPGTGWFSWLEAYEPVAIVGRSIRVYYVE
jgi:4-amino-4-deoxy-L-arabinose transferase-like glycosyltransferase